MTFFYNRVKFRAVSGGTGDFVVNVAITGYRTPAVAGVPDSTVVSYTAESDDLLQWETGVGTYASGTITLDRTTVRESTNGGALVNFTLPPAVWIDWHAQDTVLGTTAGQIPFNDSGQMSGDAGLLYNATSNLLLGVDADFINGLIVGFSGSPVADQVQVGDALFNMDFNSGNPQIVFDTNDFLRFTRGTNTWSFIVAATAELSLNTSALFPATNDDLALGTGALSFSDLFLASGGVINWANGNYTLTHSSGLLTASGNLALPNTGLIIGASVPFSDAAGTLTLQNIDALDATTETTIETAIDALANLTSIQGINVTFSDAGFDVVYGWDDSANTYKSLLLADILTEAAPTTGDFILMYGAEGDLRKFNWSSLPSGVPGGADTNVQYNDGGVFGGDAAFNWNESANSLVINGTAAQNTYFFSVAGTIVSHVIDATAVQTNLDMLRWVASNAGPHLDFGKSRGASVGTFTVVAADDTLGSIGFWGTDGTEYQQAARIQAFVDGTPGAGDMPGRLIFSTSADGAATPIERLRLKADGTWGVNQNAQGIVWSDAGFDVLFGWDDATTTYKSLLLADIASEGSPTTGDFVLIYGAEGDLRRVNWNLLPGASGGTNAFGVVAVSGQSDIVADASPDTLTIAAGTGITLTTDAGTDTLTITSTGATNAFGTIIVAGQSNIVADAAPDSLTIVAGSGIVLTTDAGTDTLTITGTGTGTPGGADSNVQYNNGGAFGGDADFNWNDTNNTLVLRGSQTQDSYFFSQPNVLTAHVIDATQPAQALGALRWTADTSPASISLGKSRGAAVDTFTVVQDGDGLGAFVFFGADGTDMAEAARIQVAVDGTPGGDDMPGRIIFRTTPNASATSIERMRIWSTGEVNIGDQTTSSGKLYINWPTDASLDSFSTRFQMVGPPNSDWMATYIGIGAVQSAPEMAFGKTRATSPTVLTDVVTLDRLLGMRAYGAFGGGWRQAGAFFFHAKDPAGIFVPGEFYLNLTGEDGLINHTVLFASYKVSGTSSTTGGLVIGGNFSVILPRVSLDVYYSDATTNTVVPMQILHRYTSGTPATGIGQSIQFVTETGVDNHEFGATIEVVTTDVTAASEDFDFKVLLMAGGAAAAEKFRIVSDGTFNANSIKYTSSDAGFDVVYGWDDSASTYKSLLLADIGTEAAPATGDFLLMYGAEGDLRKVNWSSLPTGTGDVVGPASSTDLAIARWDGTTGKLLQDSAVFITDVGRLVFGSATGLTDAGEGYLQLLGTGGSVATIEKSSMTGVNYGNHLQSANWSLKKSRSGAVGAFTVVQDGDYLGRMSFYGDDGDQFIAGAAIAGRVDGTPGNNDMPSRLEFGTTPEAGSFYLVRMVIDPAGQVSLGDDGTVDPNSIFQVQQDATTGRYGMNLLRFGNNAFSPTIALAKTRAATVAGDVIVLDDDILGSLDFIGDDGANYIQGAYVRGEVDGTPGTNDMPGRLLFATTADGASSSSERLRIDSEGDVTVGSSAVKLFGGFNSRFTVENINAATQWASAIFCDSDNSSAPTLLFARSRAGGNATTGTRLGAFSFYGFANSDWRFAGEWPIVSYNTTGSIVATRSALQHINTAGDEYVCASLYPEIGTGSLGIGAGFSNLPEKTLHPVYFLAETNTVQNILRLGHWSTATPTAGIGVGMDFQVQTASGNREIGATIEAITTDVTAASEDFDLSFKVMTAGATAAEKIRIKSTGVIAMNGFDTTWSDATFDVVYGWDDSASTYKSLLLADLTTEASPLAGDFVLIYGAEGDLRKVNWNLLPGATGGTNAFGTIIVAGQSDIVADASPDSLTIVAGTGITLTTDAGTDTLTITASGSGTPGGADTNVQYNDGGAFGGEADFTWNETTNLLTVGSDDATDNAVTNTLKLRHTTSGTPANGIGVGMQFEVETSAGNNEIGMTIEAVTSDVTAASEDFDFTVKLMKAGAAATTLLHYDTNIGRLNVGTGTGGSAGWKLGNVSGLGFVGIWPSGVASPSNSNFAILCDANNTSELDFNNAGQVNFLHNNNFRIQINSADVLVTGAPLSIGNADTQLSRTAAGMLRVNGTSALTNTVQRVETIRHTTSGTPGTGIGVSLGFEQETAADNFEIGAIIEAVTTDATAASEDFDFRFLLMAAGAAAAEKFRIVSDGTFNANSIKFTSSDAGFDVVFGWDDSADTYKSLLLVDILTEASPAAGDFVLMYGAEGDLRKVDWSSLPGGSATPGGADTNIQYNDGGSFGGDADFTFTESTNVVTLTGMVVNAAVACAMHTLNGGL